MSENIKIHVDNNINSNMSCSECIFFVPLTDNDQGNGECRLNPPSVFPAMQHSGISGTLPKIQLMSFYPIVKDGQWCGQFLHRRETEIHTSIQD